MIKPCILCMFIFYANTIIWGYPLERISVILWIIIAGSFLRNNDIWLWRVRDNGWQELEHGWLARGAWAVQSSNENGTDEVICIWPPVSFPSRVSIWYHLTVELMASAARNMDYGCKCRLRQHSHNPSIECSLYSWLYLHETNNKTEWFDYCNCFLIFFLF